MGYTRNLKKENCRNYKFLKYLSNDVKIQNFRFKNQYTVDAIYNTINLVRTTLLNEEIMTK